MWVLVSLSFLHKLLWLSGPHLSEEEGVEGKDGVAWLSREMWGEVPQKCHQKPEIQHFHLCAWGELDFCVTCERNFLFHSLHSKQNLWAKTFIVSVFLSPHWCIIGFSSIDPRYIYIYITFTFCVNNYSLLLMKWMNYSRKWLCHWCNDHILEKKPPTCKVVGLFQMNLRAGLKLSMQTRTALLSETAPWRL